MGFDSGLYKVKKYKDATLKQIEVVDRKYEYDNNSWAKENNLTFESYCDDENATNNLPSQDIIDYYCANMVTDEFGYKHVYDELGSWCSSAVFFHEWITRNFKLEDDYKVELDKESVIKCINFLMNCEEFKFDLKHVNVVNAYKECEDDTIKLIPCDGVEIQDEEGNLRRVSCVDYFDDSEFFTCGICFDSWEYTTAKDLLNCFIKILTTVDFDKEYVYYCGGW